MVRSSVTHLCTERLCARALLRPAQTFEHVGQTTSCFVGTSSTIDNVDKFEGTYRPLCDAARSVCATVHLVLSHPQKLGLGTAVQSLLTRSNTMCVEEMLQQSFVSYVAV